MDNTNNNIILASISKEAKKAYLNYAMSVIVSRALPDVHDGLKPVQRRVIYAMRDQGITHSSRFTKSAAVVGEVLKKYHPHGDTSVYDAMVRMGQDFSLRYLLITPQGNFGSIDGDSPAAMRYTETKLSKIAGELLSDIDKDTVDFIPNYSGEYLEPKKLPSKIPNVLLNGAIGIAVGMATSIPTHNLGEVIDALIFMLDSPEPLTILPTNNANLAPPYYPYTPFESLATVKDILKFIKGPDFPTGGIIYGKEGIKQYFATGKGRVVQRAKIEIEEFKNGKVAIIVKEIPFMVNKANLIAKIADMVREKKIDGITDLRDETSRNEIRIFIGLRKDVRPQRILNNLYKHTELQKSFNANMVALVNGEPKLLTIKMILEEFIRHRQIVVFKRTVFLLKKAKEREHILLGLKIALDNIDAVIETIRKSQTSEIAKNNLIERFRLSEIQATAILDMQLRKLAALERKKIEDELAEIVKKIKECIELLQSTKGGLLVVKQELITIKNQYSDGRKTKIISSEAEDFEEEELIKKEDIVITISKAGYVKRLTQDTYKKQIRGGKGIKGAGLKKEDVITGIKSCTTHNDILFFSNLGKVYKQKAWEIPEASRQAKGTPIVNVLDLSSNETITEFLPLNIKNTSAYVFMGTTNGTIKRVALENFSNIRTSGIRAINLQEGDNLGWASITTGKDSVILVTRKGKSIKFSEKDVRLMGRTASGVRGMRLSQNDLIVSMVTLNETSADKNSPKPQLLIVTSKGYGKKTFVAQYPKQKRGGSGVKTANVTSKNGNVVSAKLVKEGTDDLIIISTHGQVIRVPIKDITTQSRNTQGVIIMRLSKNDEISSIALVNKKD